MLNYKKEYFISLWFPKIYYENPRGVWGTQKTVFQVCAQIRYAEHREPTECLHAYYVPACHRQVSGSVGTGFMPAWLLTTPMSPDIPLTGLFLLVVLRLNKHFLCNYQRQQVIIKNVAWSPLFFLFFLLPFEPGLTVPPRATVNSQSSCLGLLALELQAGSAVHCSTPLPSLESRFFHGGQLWSKAET